MHDALGFGQRDYLRNAEFRSAVLGMEIEPMHAAFETELRPRYEDRPPGLAEENIQVRARGVILMGLSNKFGSMLPTIGNKSEVAVGYCTLYGDMAGGFAVISDVPETTVYTLADHINARAGRELIPVDVISEPHPQTPPGSV